jgi:hypothetical protein
MYLLPDITEYNLTRDEKNGFHVADRSILQDGVQDV